jgi:hypothetical protein
VSSSPSRPYFRGEISSAKTEPRPVSLAGRVRARPGEIGTVHQIVKERRLERWLRSDVHRGAELPRTFRALVLLEHGVL